MADQKKVGVECLSRWESSQFHVFMHNTDQMNEPFELIYEVCSSNKGRLAIETPFTK